MQQIGTELDEMGYERKLFSIGATTWLAISNHVFISNSFNSQKSFCVAETVAAGWHVTNCKKLRGKFFETADEAVRHLESVETFELGPLIDA